MQYYEINEQTARRANDVNSMSDYRPGSATEEYRAAVDKAAALVQARKAKISPYYHDKLDALLDRYARRLADYYNAYYRNESACPSILVCGGSNFPVRKKQKQNARCESLWQEYKEIDAILDKIRSVGTGAVDLTDPHARELLQARLQQEQNALDYCKAANAYYRKNKTLDGFEGIPADTMAWITKPKVYPAGGRNGDGSPLQFHGKPFPTYALSNSNANIKRVKERITKLEAAKAAAPVEEERSGYTYREDTEAMRVQLIFDGKPDDETRELLKRNGFRWSPRNSAWQRQLTANGKYAAHQVMDVLDGNA